MGVEIKKVPAALVYYRSMPMLVENFISIHKGFTFSKDGASADLGHSCPRMTIYVEHDQRGNLDEDVVIQLERILKELDANNQISGYVMKIKYSRK